MAARRVAGPVLVLLGSVLAVVALISHFVSNELLDTDRYVATVAPLADDPAVQAAISAEATDSIVSLVDVEDLGPLAEPGFEVLVGEAVRSVVASDEFARVWVEANRATHREFVALVTGEAGDVVAAGRGGTVTVRLGDLLANAGDPFSKLGLDLSGALEDVAVEIVVIRSDVVAVARQFVPWLDPVAANGPWLVLAAWAGAVGIAPPGSRLRTLAGVGLGAAVAAAAVLLAVDVGRDRYLDSLPPDGLPPTAVASMFDALVEPLQSQAWTVLVAGLAVAALAFLGSLVRPR